MIRYAPMACRHCGRLIEPHVAAVEESIKARRFSDCNYRCVACEVYYSNAKDADDRRMIYAQPGMNVPGPVRDGLDEILATALNRKNRPNKPFRFCSEISEDAVTWTVFQYLNATGQLQAVLNIASFRPSTILFWGSQWPVSETDSLRAALVAAELGLGEDRQKLTEPDVILLSSNRLVFVEVKYRSKNSKESRHEKFNKYLSRIDAFFAASAETVKQMGYYELVRNWVVGQTLARKLGITFTLVNLANPSEAASAAQFARLLSEPQNFLFVSWPELIERLRHPLDAWFGEYARAKGLGRMAGL